MHRFKKVGVEKPKEKKKQPETVTLKKDYSDGHIKSLRFRGSLEIRNKE